MIPAEDIANASGEQQLTHAVSAIRDVLNDLARVEVDLTHAIEALSINLGALISQLPEDYRAKTIAKVQEIVTMVVVDRERRGQAGGARMIGAVPPPQ